MTTIFLALALISGAILRFFSGAQNAAFYAKGRKEIPPYIQRWVTNLHTLETPQWYAQAAQTFFMFLAFSHERGVAWWPAIAAAVCFAMGASSIGSPFYQGVINESVGRPFIDPDENPKSEFAFVWFGREVSVWWLRPWRGWARLAGPVIGAGYFYLAIYLTA